LSEQNHISTKDIPDYKLGDYSGRPISKHDLVEVPEKTKKNFWKHTPFGRTLSLRNDSWKKALKIAGGTVGTILTAYTGIKLDFIPKSNTEPMLLLIENFSLESLFGDPVSGIITAVVIILAVFSGYIIRKGWLSKKAIDKIKTALNEFKKAKNENSPGGKNLTEGELASIQNKTLGAIEEALLHHGIDIDLDGDGR
jgi:hypothetical protein